MAGKGSKQYVWINGAFVAFEDAKVHILTHSMQYGSGVFEGIRCYSTAKGPSIFRLKDHVRRFGNSAKIHKMRLGYGAEELARAIEDLVRKNSLDSCYIRPFAFFDDTNIGLGVAGKKVSVAIAALPFGSYFKEKDRGIRCKVSSWRRINSDVLPPMAKASGNYLNSIIASSEAKEAGADEAILLSEGGYVAEGPGENIFLVKNGRLITPSEDADILLGITRDSIIKLAEQIGIEVEERGVHREELYTADELFFSGTAAEITPVVSVDGITIGAGGKGPITKVLDTEYSKAVIGEREGFESWCHFVGR